MKTDNIVVEKRKAFALRIIKLYQYLCESKNEYTLSKQLLRSGTSIGANIKEAIRGQSKADFVFKLNISLKEASETEYWLELMLKADISNDEIAKVLLHDCGSIRRMLVSSINTMKNKE